MSKKKSFTDNLSSVVFMWIAVGFAILAIFMIFCPAIYIGGKVRSSTLLFFQEADGYWPGWPIFAGYMAMILAVCLITFIALPFVNPSIKTEKRCLRLASLLLAFGAVTSFLSTIIYLCMTGQGNMIKMYDVYAGPFLAGSFAVIAAGFNCFALKLDL